MSDVSRISTENMNEHLITRINAIEDLSGLNTEEQTSFVNALNEVLGKLTIVGSIGSPLSTSDRWVDMGAKIDEIVEELKDNLSNKGIHVQGKVLSELVKMIPDIPEDTEEIRANIMGMLSESIGAPTTPEDSVNDMCEKIDGITQDFRDKLTEKGVSIEGTEKINELINKVDAVGNTGEVIVEWSTKADMPTARGYATSELVDGKIYVIAGLERTTKNERYNPSDDSWESMKTKITAVIGPGSAVIGDIIYVTGGSGSDIISHNECYDTINNSWTSKTSMKNVRYQHASCSYNDKVYVFGGISTAGYTTNSVECYDPLSNTWTDKANLPFANSGCECECVGDKIYIIGAPDGQIGSTFSYDPETDTCTVKSPMRTTRQFMTTTVLDNEIYCIGGKNANSNGLNTVDKYNCIEDKWYDVGSSSVARFGAVSETVGNSIYTIGGAIQPYNVELLTTNECLTIIKKPNASVQALVNTIGEPCTTEDSVYDICDKLEVMTDNLRDSLEEKGVGVTEEDKLNSLIEKVDGVGSKAVAGDTFIVYQDLNEYNNSSHKNYGGYGKINNFRFPYVMLDGSYKISFQARGGASNLITTTYYKIDRCTDYNGNVVVESKEISTKSYENVTLSVIFDNVKKGDTFKISMANITEEGGSTTTYISRVHLTVDAAYL